MAVAADRLAYEAAVRGLRRTAARWLQRGKTPEETARHLVDCRNRLKAKFRVGVPARLLLLIEARNLAKYGDALGPSAGALLARYGSWDAVIAAACRPADLSGGGTSDIVRP